MMMNRLWKVKRSEFNLKTIENQEGLEQLYRSIMEPYRSFHLKKRLFYHILDQEI